MDQVAWLVVSLGQWLNWKMTSAVLSEIGYLQLVGRRVSSTRSWAQAICRRCLVLVQKRVEPRLPGIGDTVIFLLSFSTSNRGILQGDKEVSGV